MAGTIEEKARGAFFTPAEIAEYMAQWSIRSPGDDVLEPSCGEAVFLRAAGRALREVSQGSSRPEGKLSGVELHETSAVQAREILANEGFTADVAVGDFFEHSPEIAYDVVLGNPPYVRYQEFSGAARAKSLEAALAQGVRLSGLASSWAAFVIKAALHLKPQGRLALVLPAELLSVGYAAEVRRFLLNRFASLRLVTFEERVFPGVLEDVVLLLAEGSGGANSFQLHQARNAASLAEDAKDWTDFVPSNGGKWTPALVAQHAFQEYDALASQVCEPLSSWGRAYLGSVTGNNSFFTLTEEEANRYGISSKELLRISPPGSRHLKGLEFSTKAWKALCADGQRGYLFYPGANPSYEAQKYIEEGEQRDVSKAYKCRVRKPWWRVPLVDTPDLLLTYMNHDRPRLIANNAKATIINSVYGLMLKDDRKEIGKSLLPLACLNSVTLLGAEVVGRAYGGGLLKLEPREADKLPVPSLEVVNEKKDRLQAIKPQLGSALRSGRLEEACMLVDPIVLEGVTDATLANLRQAREVLFNRRKVRGGNGQSR
ncbi:HsdM family class I SAM-dependent methyltransferase [Thioclava electrotropha]|uniref:HsdM family class I SAM-dependent methyltransferase n=1 Tax=Thioclava electrotropha TaxID=1549850 RepID=UPI0013FDFEE1|nr:N-6 DNA methylase [Thioclava electrotropha]